MAKLRELKTDDNLLPHVAGLTAGGIRPALTPVSAPDRDSRGAVRGLLSTT